MSTSVPAGDELLSYLPRLRLRFNSEASLVASDAGDDPATLEWTCRAVLPLCELSDEDDAAANERLLAPDVSLSRTSGKELTELTIFSMSGLTLDLWRIHRIRYSLAARNNDYAHFAPLFDASGDMGLHPALEDCLVTGTHAVLIDQARIAPAWRGHGGVGRLLITRLLRWVIGPAALVATRPFPTDLSQNEREDEKRVARTKAVVQRTWRSLGFEPCREDVWVMKPHLRKHEDAARRLEGAFAPYLRPFSVDSG
ncbi:MAG: hypothetical protein JO362_10805 [Streptomycetaceae bacterium]|nr:hypothetical protein [Streptomycetaceae bacterium]